MFKHAILATFLVFFTQKAISQDSCVVTNLWPNGDFETTQSLLAVGWYFPCLIVTYDPIDDLPGGNLANDIDDQTPTGNGNFLWVDHTQATCSLLYNEGDNIPILRRNVQTAAGEAYNFGFWVYRYCDGSTGEFGVWINGQKVQSWDLTSTPCAVGWERFEVNFLATGPSTQITLMDVNWHSAGWDYAIDDVQLATVFAPAPYAGEDTTICMGGCARLIAQGGQPDIVASWSTTDFTSLAAGDTIIQVCPLQTTTYIVTVTNSEGCSDVDEVRVIVAKSPEITLDSTVCSADLAFFDIFFKVSTTADFTWKGAPSAQLMTQPNGSFRLKNIPKNTVIDLLTTLFVPPFCTDSLRVEPPDCSCPTVSQPSATGPTSIQICQKEPFPTLEVAATGSNFSINWFNAAIGGTLVLANSNTFLPISSGSFFVEKTDLTNGCFSSRLEFLVEKRPDPTLEITGDSAVCGLDLVNFEGKSPDPAVVFNWPDGSAGATFSFLPTNFGVVFITVEAVDIEGCRSRDTAFLDVKKPPFFEILNFECAPDRLTSRVFLKYDASQIHLLTPDTLTITPTASGEGFILAKPGQQFSVLSKADATAFSSQFCKNTSIVLVPDCACPVVQTPQPTSPVTVEICEGQAFPTFSVAQKSGISVAWFDSPTAANPLIINELAFTPTVAGTFFAEARDTIADCSSARAAFVFKINPTPKITISGDTAVCQNEPTVLVAATQPSGAQIVWQGQPPSPILNVAATQSAVYTVSATLAGCSASLGIFVEMFAPPPAPVSLGDSIFCKNTPPKSLVVSVGAGLEVNWFSSPAAPNPLIINELRIQPTTAGTFWAESFNPISGCRSATRTPVRLFESPLPTVDAGPEKAIPCNDSTIVLSGMAATNGQNYSAFWTTSDGQIVSDQNTLNPKVGAVGTYNLLIINELSGCRAADSVAVSQTPPLFGSFENEQPTCREPLGKIVFSVSGGSGGPFVFSIDGGQTFRKDSIFKNLTPAVFSSKIRDAAGCELSFEPEIFEPQKWKISLPAEIKIALGDSVFLSPTLDFSDVVFSKINWSPSAFLSCDTCLETFVTPSESMRYVISALDTSGCGDSARVLILVDPTVDFFAPTAIKMGADGANSSFTIFGARGLEEIVFLRIFDRWGGLVFDQKKMAPSNPATGWDGHFRGKKASPGVYVWVAELLFSNGKRKIVSGEVTVVW